jgi:transposase
MATVKLRNDQWSKILEFLGTCPEVYIGQAIECQRFVEGVLWVMRSGAQWRLLPRECGKWNSIYKRFGRWCDKGIWEQMMAYFADDPDMEHLMLDSTVVRAHPSAAGALKKRRTSGASSGTQPGGFSTKIHVSVFSRFDKLDVRFLGFLFFGAVLIWLR